MTEVVYHKNNNNTGITNYEETLTLTGDSKITVTWTSVISKQITAATTCQY